MPVPFFSICIPVYKNVTFLKKLLDSILTQTFTDYEIVITDDSPDDAVHNWLQHNYNSEAIHYFKNERPLGTPENWNEAIRKARGEWIKLMHDDDWFATPNALQCFYEAAIKDSSKFYFSGYQNVYLAENDRIQSMPFFYKRWERIKKYPPNIYARNIIGAPSTVLVNRGVDEWYDSRFKWLVDIDYYIRLMQKCEAEYIPLPLVNVGQSQQQVTSYTHNNPNVEIPEGLLLQSKLGDKTFEHILYFDVWWRLIRNLQIKDLDEFKKYAGDFKIPAAIKNIIRFQKKLPAGLLQVGMFSKLCMSACWLYNKRSA